jgi:RNA polymerase sigma factor (sigma-70 family)
MDRDQLLQRQGKTLERKLWSWDQDRLHELIQDRPRFLLGRFKIEEILTEVSDEGLILAIQKDVFASEAFEELMEKRYQILLFRWYRSWGVTLQDAEELVARLIVKFLSNRFQRYSPDQSHSENFVHYLCRAARNLWIQDLRRKRSSPLNGDAEPDNHRVCPLDEIIGRELQEQVQAALQDLAPLDRAVFTGMLAGSTRGELAAEYGLTLQAVSMRLFRARRHVRRHLDRNASSRPIETGS